ncbi:hypothetical protein FACS189437_06650 [Bacteroidia bacterium]|nr:hypothetical protein FACS189437_06650 [Bacteroidia bacterium]
MKMKKMMFLMLTLFMLGAESMNAQVQIGGTNGPDKSAVLDLNPDAGDAKGGLALPRVTLSSETQTLNGATAQPGTVVYNTSSSLAGEGTYVWTLLGSGATEPSKGAIVNFTSLAFTFDGTNNEISVDNTERYTVCVPRQKGYAVYLGPQPSFKPTLYTLNGSVPSAGVVAWAVCLGFLPHEE